MVFNTATVGTAVTPAIVSTLFSHYLNRKALHSKPTVHISYDEGLHLIRSFLVYASHNTVEDLQRFTAQWVPHPRWVKVEEVIIPQEYITKAADAIQAELGHHGIGKVGGKTWWQWRRPGSELKAEWIEMRTDYNERKKSGMEKAGKRCMLYVHGGAYFFGSVDEHRYQMQRHARKLKARVFAPQYRLAPQFPFPCGLHDCLSAYLFLLTIQDPSTIILAGDSAGGGMVLSMLVCIRDRGLPMPAGAVLISPWVDLTHSFPSVAGDNPMDYIPPQGFHQKPSPSWPPPTSDDIMAMNEAIVGKLAHKDHVPQSTEEDAVQGFHVVNRPDAGTQNDTAANGTASSDGTGRSANTVPGPGHGLSIMIDGKLIEIKDQIQMYASNQLISHPLVSPILQPSLGGLPPLLIQVGGGEMLRDEQIYVAHKAANPEKYPPGDAFLDEVPHDHLRNQIKAYKPTDVQLQVWDDLCHVAPTLSFTRPAKYMYRSIAQFGAWALARAQKTEIEIMDDDNVSVISSSDSEAEDTTIQKKKHAVTANQQEKQMNVGKAGDPLPAFKNHMIRQRVDRHGLIYPLEPASQLAGCQLDPSEIGVIKEGPVRKWMKAKKEWDTKFASSKRRVQKRRAKEMAKGYMAFGDGEAPPPSALAGRRRKGDADREEKRKRSMGMSLWSVWGSKHDEDAMKREEEADKTPETTVASSADGSGARPLHDTHTDHSKRLSVGRENYSRSRSRRRTVVDEKQTEGQDGVDESTSAAELMAIKNRTGEEAMPSKYDPEFVRNNPATETTRVNGASIAAMPTIYSPKDDLVHHEVDASQQRPKAGGVAFPFSLRRTGPDDSPSASVASVATLTSTGEMASLKAARRGEITGSGVSEDNNLTPKSGSSQMNGNAKNDDGVSGEVQRGGLGSAQRPPLDSFVTAQEGLPTVG